MTPTHLLWSLMLMKAFGKQREMAPKNKCDEMPSRKWVWKGLRGINHLKKDVVSTVAVIVVDNDHISLPLLMPLSLSMVLLHVSQEIQIKLSNRNNRDSQQRSPLVVDGIDSMIQEPGRMGSTQGGTLTSTISLVFSMKLPLASTLLILSASMVHYHVA